MSHTFCTTRRVEFRDTDAAGIMHFTAFFLYMEEAEHEFLRHLGLSVMMHDDAGAISWPRVAANCDYRSAAKFEEVLDIAVSIERIGDKSVTYAFRFSAGGREIANGKITAVCCRLEPPQPPRSITIPAAIRQTLTQTAS